MSKLWDLNQWDFKNIVDKFLDSMTQYRKEKIKELRDLQVGSKWKQLKIWCGRVGF